MLNISWEFLYLTNLQHTVTVKGFSLEFVTNCFIIYNIHLHPKIIDKTAFCTCTAKIINWAKVKIKAKFHLRTALYFQVI